MNNNLNDLLLNTIKYSKASLKDNLLNSVSEIERYIDNYSHKLIAELAQAQGNIFCRQIHLLNYEINDTIRQILVESRKKIEENVKKFETTINAKENVDIS